MEYQYPLDLDWTNEEMMKVIHFLIKLKIIMNPLSKVKRLSMLINNLKKLCQVKLKKKQIFKEFENKSGYNSYKVVQEVNKHPEQQIFSK